METLWLSLALLCLLQRAQSSAEWKNLSDISYRLTPCGSSGRLGPLFQQCLDHYTSTGSRVADALNPNPEQQGFLGGQGFTFPSTGWYNVTVAGASGGRGLCNIWNGLGAVFRGQVFIEKGVNDSVMVMVGQAGRGPCDVNPNYYLCSRSLTNETKAGECWSTWKASADILEFTYIGGAGGGGASMIWPQDSNGQYSNHTPPLVIMGGGGGTSVQLNYSVVPKSYSDPLSSHEELINYFLYIYAWISPQSQLGYGGHTPHDGLPAGAGGGYFPLPNHVVYAANGNSFESKDGFAQGGRDCVDAAHLDSNDALLFQDVYGGFGGGGGACDEGGGGGGNYGGDVESDESDFPGEGGYSLVQEDYVAVDYEISWNWYSDDGFVEIVLANCGCTGTCRMMTDVFLCLCEEGLLAKDGFDCYQEADLSVNSVDSLLVTNTVSASLFQLFKPALLYSAVMDLAAMGIGSGQDSFQSKQHVAGESDGGACVAIWLGEGSQLLLVSDATQSLPAEISYLHMISSDDNQQPVLSSPVRILDKGEVVSGLMLLSTGSSCIIDQIRANISVVSPLTENDPLTNITNILSASDVDVEKLAMLLLFPSSSSFTPTFSSTSILNTDSTTIPLNQVVIISSVSVVAMLLALGVIILLIVIFKYRRTRKLDMISSPGHVLRGQASVYSERPMHLRLGDRLSSLVSNPAYTNIPSPSQESTVSTPAVTPMSNDGYTLITYDKDSQSSPSRGRAYSFRPNHGVMVPDIDFYAYNKTRDSDDWYYFRGNLLYLRELGEGQFGKVLLMKAKNIAGYSPTIPVAVKTLSSTDEDEVRKFIEEVELMKRFCHPNIVSILGVDLKHEEGAPLMIMEYMPYGDLCGFLRKHRPGSKSKQLINKNHQLGFAHDVACALAFLEYHKYVHRDVAARNCLVGPTLRVKLADFGMAREMADKEYYRLAGAAVLPIRWIAPESLLYGFFTSASDVWSYGVLLWEIVTLGCTPLEDMEAEEIVRVAQEGKLTHPLPDGMGTTCAEITHIIALCHSYEPKQRPTFAEIKEWTDQF